MKDHNESKHRRKWCFSLAYKVLAMVLALLMVVESASVQVSAAGTNAEAAEITPIDLADYIADGTTIQITITIDGKKHVYTPEELVAKGLTVPKGAPAKVSLYFNTITNVQKGQTLVYQLPENLMDYSGANEYGYVWKGTVWEENTSGADVEAADWVIDNTGKLIVTLRDDFFEENKHDDDTIDLFGFNIKFSGSLSSERGEHSGNDDDKIVFKGTTDGTLSFTIPFEYKNEHANAEVKKQLVSFDGATKTAFYAIQVTAPDTNTYTAKNVVVTDAFSCDSKYIVTDSNKNIYRNYSITTSDETKTTTFDSKTGVWTIGDMKPGETATLNYSVVISDDSYKVDKLDEILNVATVTFNDDGENQAYATLELPGASIEKTAVTNGVGGVIFTENGESYISYTLTVNGNNGTTRDIRVNDAITSKTADRVKRLVVPDGGASQGTVDINNTSKSLVWYVGDVSEGETATLTYRVYLNEDSWQTTEDSRNPGTVTLQVNNSVSMYIGSNPSEDENPIDTDNVENSLTKTWVNKAGALITDTKDSKYGLMKYVVCVNGDPVSDNVKSIYDILTGGTYEDGGNIELTRYTSSTKETLVDTTEIPLSEVVSTTETGQRWDIDLVSRGLNGAYYYELVYYVKSSGVNVNNSAGIGFGVGTGYGKGTTVQGAGGMTYGTDYSKSFDRYDNKKEAYSQWYVNIQKTVPEGAIYCDWLSSEYVYNHEQFWFDDDCLNDITITFEGNTLTQGVDYTVEGVRVDNAASRRTDPNEERYYMFKITFNNEYLATSTNKMVISYKVRLNNEARDEDCLKYSDGDVVLYYNYCRWYLPEYGNLVATNQGANYSHSTYVANTPLKKGNGTYNEDDGTVTWYLTVNTQTTVEGDAVIEEYLPEGLSFVSAEISNRPFPAVSGDTTLGDITQEEYTDSNGKTCEKINISIKNLKAYTITSSIYKTADNPNGVGPTIYWSSAGEVTIKVVTKVDEAWRLNLSQNTSLTNKAVLTDNACLPAGGVTATGTATISATQQVDKSQVGKESPAYLEYALNINANGSNLIPGSDDNLEVVDIMGAGMKLATDYTNYFKVYDVTDISGLTDSSGNVIPSVAKTGTDITSSCSIVDVTGKSYTGMSSDEVGNPTYLITVPDGKHLVVLYWAVFEGADGDSVTVNNRASFLYGNALQSGSGDKTSDSVVAYDASSDLYVGAFFKLKKTDQNGNMIAGVTYSLYEVSVDSSGAVAGKTKIMTKTTDGSELLYFGHRTTDSVSVPELQKDKLYCLVEESAPAGYAIDSTPYYFEFKTKGHDEVSHPADITLHQLVSGGTYSFTNQFTAAVYELPVKKSINGKEVSSDTEFSFTLKQTSNTSSVYTDESYSTLLSESGITTSITGSGTTKFAPLYFTEVGTYTFSLTENDLSAVAASKGYSKDSNTFTVTVKVDKDTENALVVADVSFTASDTTKESGNLSTSVPTFDNGSHLTGTITLNAKKTVANRAAAVKAGEFGFTVSVGGEVIAETDEDGNTKLDANGKPVKKVFYTKEGGDIEFNIDIDQDDVGTKTYIISEVEGTDPSITYTTDRVRVRVTIAEAGNGKVAATSYEYLTDAEFINEYNAEGSITLQGTKQLKNSTTDSLSQVGEGRFNFIVMEGDTQVGTGSTEAGGSISFTEITYDASDIGEHTYVISEKDEGETYINYTTETVTAVVTVEDAGEGKLTASVKYEGLTDDNGNALFINESTLIIPTGITLDIIPYVAIIGMAITFGTVLFVKKRRKKDIAKF